MQDTSEVTRRLWSLCSVLRDEGVTYHEYLNELSYLLFLKLADELQIEELIPSESRWHGLRAAPPSEALSTYERTLQNLSTAKSKIVREIYAESSTQVRNSMSLHKLISEIDAIDWYRAKQNGLGDVYEGLIEKNAQESRYGAGQYFTPRPVVDALVKVLKPTGKETVYDPATGTAGFLVAAGLFSRLASDSSLRLVGNELVHDVQRMALMNLLLHGLRGDIKNVDTLSQPPLHPAADVILTNPPFGLKGSLSSEQKKQLDFPTSNKQLAFIQHCYKSLAKNGRAAIVVPDNVLFESGVACSIRKVLLDQFRLHTVLSLPIGIFYATGIRTSVLLISNDGGTEGTWFYNLRNGSASYGKRRQLTDRDLDDFVTVYGEDPHGRSPRQSSKRFHYLSRDEIAADGERLDKAERFTSDTGSTAQASNLLDLTDLLSSELDTARSAVESLERILGTFGLSRPVAETTDAQGMGE
ncbi:N-6 DNA methylase [Streptomyces sp. NPDC002387]|uniref:class I SAM-dependent DNA methyltransferase n=1 Tax=Streptomyces sp. NPDC002387 TaxID=3364643 RepID=UPI0036755D44